MKDRGAADAAREGVGQPGTRGGPAAAWAVHETGTITCRQCDDEGVRADHGGQAVVACPSCREILYRPVGGSEPAV